jgi:hypothetical protein
MEHENFAAHISSSQFHVNQDIIQFYSTRNGNSPEMMNKLALPLQNASRHSLQKKFQKGI